LKVVPNVRWGDRRTYDFVFEGLPKNATVAVSTHGCIRERVERHYFRNGLAKMVEALEPRSIINHGQTPDDIFGRYKKDGIEVVEMPCHALAIRRRPL
jgi:hypothetical protein